MELFFLEGDCTLANFNVSLPIHLADDPKPIVCLTALLLFRFPSLELLVEVAEEEEVHLFIRNRLASD